MTSTPRVASQLVYAALMVVAVCAIATAAIWVRFAGETSPAFLVVGRTLLSGLLLLPWLVRAPLSRAERRLATGAGIFLGLHFFLWFASLSRTTVAASTMLVCTTPLWLALVDASRGRRPSGVMWVALSLALGGVALIGGGDSRTEHGLLGDALALAGALAVAGYFLCNRRARADSTAPLLPYVCAVNLIAAAALTPVVAAQAMSGNLQVSSTALLAIVGLALAPQMIGHNLLVWALRDRGPTAVTLVVLGEPVFAAVLAYAFWRETPVAATILGCGLILPAVALALVARPEQSMVEAAAASP